MRESIKRVLARLPIPLQQELRRWQCRAKIARGTLTITEPEGELLPSLVPEGSFVIDVGANLGYYTLRLSELVGATGRVLAVEPVPDTFAVLASNVLAFRHRNVTLFNVAASDSMGIVNIDVPQMASGLPNWYDARLSANGGLPVVTMPLDSLGIAQPVKLIKLDTEGHELPALTGLRATIERHRPTLIVETGDGSEAVQFIKSLGYGVRRLPGSPNVLCEWA